MTILDSAQSNVLPAWTDERVAALKELLGDGYSCGAIARELGNVSRSAVSGKINRLGLSNPRPATPKRQPLVSLDRGRPTLRDSRPKPAPATNPFRTYADPGQPIELLPERSPNQVTLWDAQPHHCRWPVSETGALFMFCGDNQQYPDDPGKQYCARHHRMAHR